MKRLAFAALLSLALCAALPAQQPSFFAVSSAQPSAPPAYNFDLVPALAPPAVNSLFIPSPALPDAPAPPKSGYQNDDFYRWNLGIGYEYVHFKSAPFSANMSGLHTDLTYNLYDWLGLEGNVVSTWGGDIYGARSKFVLYAAGARVGWGQSSRRRRLTPWVHALVGGTHVNPQTAGGKNGFALQAGGGADLVWNQRIALRAEADYVRTMLYSSSQNNFQIGLGAVIHF
jgi:hypothetical protein